MAMDGQQQVCDAWIFLAQGHTANCHSPTQLLSAHLKKADPAVFNIIESEKKRQKHFINLIPSENFTSQAVLDALGSVMQSEFSRGTIALPTKHRH